MSNSFRISAHFSKTASDFAAKYKRNIFFEKEAFILLYSFSPLSFLRFEKGSNLGSKRKRPFFTSADAKGRTSAFLGTARVMREESLTEVDMMITFSNSFAMTGISFSMNSSPVSNGYFFVKNIRHFPIKILHKN